MAYQTADVRDLCCACAVRVIADSRIRKNKFKRVDAKGAETTRSHGELVAAQANVYRAKPDQRYAGGKTQREAICCGGHSPSSDVGAKSKKGHKINRVKEPGADLCSQSLRFSLTCRSGMRIGRVHSRTPRNGQNRPIELFSQTGHSDHHNWPCHHHILLLRLNRPWRNAILASSGFNSFRDRGMVIAAGCCVLSVRTPPSKLKRARRPEAPVPR